MIVRYRPPEGVLSDYRSDLSGLLQIAPRQAWEGWRAGQVNSLSRHSGRERGSREARPAILF